MFLKKKDQNIYDERWHEPVGGRSRASWPDPLPAEQGPDIPAFREQLAIPVSTGKAKEAIGLQLTQEHVKHLDANDVEKYYKRYEICVGAKTTETFVDSSLSLNTRVVGAFVPIKDVEVLMNGLRKAYIVTKELSTFSETLRWDVGGCSCLPKRHW